MALSYHISGIVAKKRILPLLEARGIKITEAKLSDSNVDFMWENTPSKERKTVRDGAQVYSHLAQGYLLEDKWALALLQQKVPQQTCPLLESYCLRGREEVAEWCRKRWASSQSETYPTSSDLWVLKDAESNGAGGIWILSNNNWNKLCAKECEPLHKGHRYVAQKYVDRLALWKGRKFHIRTYVVVSADLGVYIHRKAFLHIANKIFARQGGSEADDEVHITNCCANSDNLSSFAGEVVIDDLTAEATYPGTGNENTKWGNIDDAGSEANAASSSSSNNRGDSGAVDEISFSTGFRDMCDILSSIVEAAAPFLEAQTSQQNFEYMGVDFMIDESGRAWLLECNCPPSQDTATGLKHAEDLHNTVMNDVLGTFVLPHCFPEEAPPSLPSVQPLTGDKATAPVVPQVSVEEEEEEEEESGGAVLKRRYNHLGGWVEARKPSLIPFSPASKTMGNNLRWKMYENKCMRKEINQNKVEEGASHEGGACAGDE